MGDQWTATHSGLVVPEGIEALVALTVRTRGVQAVETALRELMENEQ